MNKFLMLTKVVENGGEEAVEETVSFLQRLNDNPGALQFAGLVIAAIGVIALIVSMRKKGRK